MRRGEVRIGISGWRYSGCTAIACSIAAYSDASLAAWAERVDAWAEGGEPRRARRIATVSPRARTPRDIYLYFDNDMKVHAPFDAARPLRALSLPTAIDASQPTRAA